MRTRARSFWVAALAVTATALAGASIAWACTTPDYGTPQTPPAPPPPASGAPSGQGAIATPPASGTTSGSASGSTSGANASAPSSSTSHSVSTAPVNAPASVGSRQAAPQATSVAAGSGAGAFAARLRGATAGVAHQGGHGVFASSVAPKAKARAHASHPAHAASRAAAPSPRSATSDVWSGFGAPSRSPVYAAASAVGQGGGGVSSQVLAGIVILGLGLAGVVGGGLAVAARRRGARVR